MTASTHTRVDIPAALAFTARTALVEGYLPLRTAEIEPSPDETRRRALCCLFVLWSYARLLDTASIVMECKHGEAWRTAYDAGYQLNPLLVNYWAQPDQLEKRFGPGPFPNTPFLLMELFDEQYDRHRSMGGNPIAIVSNADQDRRERAAVALLLVDTGLRNMLPQLKIIYKSPHIEAGLSVAQSFGCTCTNEMIGRFVAEHVGQI